MSNSIQNYIEVYGANGLIENLITDLMQNSYDIGYGYNTPFGEHLKILDHQDMHLKFTFETVNNPNIEWYNYMKSKHRYLTTSLFWIDYTQPPRYGYINEQGISSEINNRDDSIQAAKLLSEYKRSLND